MPLDYLCRRLDASPERALALESILTHTTDNRSAPPKEGAGTGRSTQKQTTRELGPPA
ncbi:hypothetical protein ACE1SV_34030 [Streptomyces sennicomposti]